MKNNNLISTTVSLNQSKLRKLKKYLKVKNDVEAITKAVDLLVDNSEIEQCILNAAGKCQIEDVFDRTKQHE